MIFSLFILAMIVITLIARYNEDDHLFWQLLISFSVAFALTTTIVHLTNNEQRKHNSTTQVCPTQEPANQMDIYYPTTGIASATTTYVTGTDLVSKDFALDSSFVVYNVQKISSKGRDRPYGVFNLHKPRDIGLTILPWDTS